VSWDNDGNGSKPKDDDPKDGGTGNGDRPGIK